MIEKIRKKILVITFSFCVFQNCFSQLKWRNVDSLFQPLPSSVHVYFTDQPVDAGAFHAYYLIADLKDKHLEFTADTTLNRRLTPAKFYEKNDKPLVVVNCTFFSFETNRNLNVVIRDGKVLAYNQHSIAGRGRDTLTYWHAFRSAIGISKKRKADIAWLYSDSSSTSIEASESVVPPFKDSIKKPERIYFLYKTSVPQHSSFQRWKTETAVGGGPVVLQHGDINITNEEERMFTGRAINDKHPRTAMG